MARRMSAGKCRSMFRRYDLGRSLSWGWEYALRCARSKVRPLRRFDGPWTCEATRLARELSLTGEEATLSLSRRCRRSWQAIAEAHAILQADAIQRWAIEARVLARQSDQEIAAVEQVNEDTVAAYEALFFQVRDRLGGRSWINNYVLQLGTPWSGRDVAKIWKYFAYNANAIVLQTLMDDFIASGKPDYQDLDTGWFTDFPDDCPQRWLHWSIQSLLLPPKLSEEQTRKLAELHCRLIAAKQLSPQTGTEALDPPLEMSFVELAKSVGLRDQTLIA